MSTPSPVAGFVRRAAPYAGIAVIVAYCLAPFYWMVVSSFRRSSDIFDLSALPSPWSLENYRAVFSGDNQFGQALLNSVIVAGITTAATVVIATFAAYALARLRFRFTNAVLAIVIATSMFPGISLLVPLLKLFTDIGWINTYQSMIVPNLSFALPLAIWYLTTFFRQLPHELEEAARVDGCTPGQAFRKVILPIAVPGVFTTAIIVFVVAWNEFIIALTMVNDPAMQTATVRISQFVGVAAHDSPFGTRMAAGVVATVPLVIAVLLFQRRIVAGLTSGGVK
ncbi:carbohydrate ABC transporter permease [Saccharomonospora piscinae]|uniref:Sugar ABC transporter permease n=1 Tax=Saccharomonospora piscinae TaxID=687388 RepID=A0A1V9ACH4_SACPI|nr:carbohydrate ABC transporter permease [Saccharomonospora piscinae]OQO94738.1 sugar ABC transporter permease [Saccharomonospora piscinae]TLW94556.1 carbohydrate ABC transporter permease [Saccharomonospora piscinae]